MADVENMTNLNGTKKSPPDPTPNELRPRTSKHMTSGNTQNNDGLSVFKNITQQPLDYDISSQVCELGKVEESREDKLQSQTFDHESEMVENRREDKLQKFWEEAEEPKTALEKSLGEKKKENERLVDEITKCKIENKVLEIKNLAILKEKENIEKENSTLERAKKEAQEQTKKAENNFNQMQDELMKVKNEKTGEIYDNEWTNAFEELKTFLGKGRNELNEEEETIHILLDILQYIFNSAKLLTSSYRANLCCDISRIPVQSVDKGKEDSSTSKQKDVFLTLPVEKSKEVLKHVSDICIRMAADCSLIFQKHIMPDIECRLKTRLNISTETTEETLSFPDVIEYAKSCVRLCWLMGIRDPPIEMVFSATVFDKDVVKEYTKRGKEIKYFVWPILYLHENGPLLSKGIVQGNEVE